MSLWYDTYAPISLCYQLAHVVNTVRLRISTNYVVGWSRDLPLFHSAAWGHQLCSSTTDKLAVSNTRYPTFAPSLRQLLHCDVPHCSSCIASELADGRPFGGAIPEAGWLRLSLATIL